MEHKNNEFLTVKSVNKDDSRNAVTESSLDRKIYILNYTNTYMKKSGGVFYV